MNNHVIESDEREIKVFRGDTELKTGDVYFASESLTESIDVAKNQYVYEVNEDSGAKFEKGGCGGTRRADHKQAVLIMSDTPSKPVTIIAG